MSPQPDPRPTTRHAVGTDGDGTRIAVDRVACTGHGACAGLLPAQVRLDQWGYPIVLDERVDETDGAIAVRLCPARALYLR